MRKDSLLSVATILFVTTLVISCQKNALNQKSEISIDIAAKANQQELYNVFYSPQVSMGKGKIRSWIRISHTNVPAEIGVEITHNAFQNLPEDPLDFAAATFVIPLHKKATETTPFDHIMVNWNAQGHEPPGIYDVPHFDFHFYTMSLADRLAIPPYEAAMALFDNLPPASYLPPTYIPTEGGVPQMGKHWVDVTSPELNGQPFTSTLIYGSYDGKVTFIEPMITIAILMGGQSFTFDIPQPQDVDPINTWYPTKYNIWMDNTTNKHYVTLSDFVWR